jgi:signal peptidase II
MKLKHVLFTVFIVLVLDQILKIYVKTHFSMSQGYNEINIIGDWFKLHFLENEGMAFGMKFGGEWGKLALTVFRIIACIWGFYFIQNTLIKQRFSNGLIFCASLILAGALGNSIDSIFYGKIFTDSSFHLNNIAKFAPWGQGYGSLFHGKVVDMLYFPILKGNYPSWFPIWAGQDFEFFRPVFNLADAAISLGVFSIFIFQSIILKQHNSSENEVIIQDDVSEL